MIRTILLVQKGHHAAKIRQTINRLVLTWLDLTWLTRKWWKTITITAVLSPSSCILANTTVYSLRVQYTSAVRVLYADLKWMVSSSWRRELRQLWEIQYIHNIQKYMMWCAEYSSSTKEFGMYSSYCSAYLNDEFTLLNWKYHSIVINCHESRPVIKYQSPTSTSISLLSCFLLNYSISFMFHFSFPHGDQIVDPVLSCLVLSCVVFPWDKQIVQDGPGHSLDPYHTVILVGIYSIPSYPWACHVCCVRWSTIWFFRIIQGRQVSTVVIVHSPQCDNFNSIHTSNFQTLMMSAHHDERREQWIGDRDPSLAYGGGERNDCDRRKRWKRQQRDEKEDEDENNLLKRDPSFSHSIWRGYDWSQQKKL